MKELALLGKHLDVSKMIEIKQFKIISIVLFLISFLYLPIQGYKTETYPGQYTENSVASKFSIEMYEKYGSAFKPNYRLEVGIVLPDGSFLKECSSLYDIDKPYFENYYFINEIPSKYESKSLACTHNYQIDKIRFLLQELVVGLILYLLYIFKVKKN